MRFQNRNVDLDLNLNLISAPEKQFTMDECSRRR